MSSEPRLSSRAPVMTTSFEVVDAPKVYGATDHGKKHGYTPNLVVIEKRPRGIRAQVKCRMSNGQIRTVNFNIDGYPYQPAPHWLIKLWKEALDAFI